jgi:hypothetical protein
MNHLKSLPHLTVQISNNSQYLGSGVLVKVDNSFYVLSAAHVPFGDKCQNYSEILASSLSYKSEKYGVLNFVKSLGDIGTYTTYDIFAVEVEAITCADNFPTILFTDDTDCPDLKFLFRGRAKSASENAYTVEPCTKNGKLQSKIQLQIPIGFYNDFKGESGAQVLQGYSGSGVFIHDNKSDLAYITSIVQSVSPDNFSGVNCICISLFCQYLIPNIELVKYKESDHNHTEAIRNIDCLLTNSLDKIGNEKLTKKYIPEIFNETSSVKYKARLFSNPVFFAMILEYNIKAIDFSVVNYFFEKISVPKLKINLEVENAFVIKSGCLQSLNERVEIVREELLNILYAIKPFTYSSMYNKDVVNDENKSYYRILKFSIAAEANMIEKSIESILDDIKSIKSKVFLITSFAGQGKTNFLCDFTEGFCSRFNIPAIFIPARELNAFSGNYIINFIKNNRFFNHINDKFDFFKFAETVSQEIKLPLIILIDGINEIKDHESFKSDLIDFLSISSQYDTIKIIITCRSEFFEKQYNYFEDKKLSEITYHVKDLKSELNTAQRHSVFDAYLNFYKIQYKFSDKSKNALINDFLLLRIFCESNEGQSGKSITDIYKTNLFEKYIVEIVAGSFDSKLKHQLLPTLLNLAKHMIDTDDFCSVLVSSDNLTPIEMSIIEQLIHDDVILRRELPSESLLSLGEEQINFTYDEFRDFIISFYIVNKCAKIQEVKYILSKLKGKPAYEGVIKFCYLLSREKDKTDIVNAIESMADFYRHYVNSIQNLENHYLSQHDTELANKILSLDNKGYEFRKMSFILFKEHDCSSYLHIGILINYLNSLEDEVFSQVVPHIFGGYYDYHSGYCSKVDKYISSISSNTSNLDQNVIVFSIQVSILSESFTRWKFFEICSELPYETIQHCNESLKNSNCSLILKACQTIVNEAGNAHTA